MHERVQSDEFQRGATAHIASLPKVELHVHLEGSMRAATVVELATKSGTEIPRSLADGRWAFVDFADFMSQYSGACRTLSRREHFFRIATEFVEDAAAANVRYVEVTFTPEGHASRLGSWHWPLESVLDGLSEAGSRHGVHAQVILDHSREYSIADALATAELAVSNRRRGVVALGLGGDERDDARPFKEAFALARDSGLGTVAHAGETTGPESIWTAIDELGASRIGHGLAALSDDRLMARLIADGIVLEVCPTSNVRTGVVGSMSQHPWPRLLASGVPVTVNSDDPGMFSTDVAGELAIIRRIWGAEDALLATLMQTAITRSYAPLDVRRRIETEIDAWITSR